MTANAGNGGTGRVGVGLSSLRPAGKRPIGEMLVDAGLIERRQLEEALSVQAEKGGKLVQVLITLGFFEPSSFVRFLAQQPGVASIDLSNYEVSRDLIDLVPKEFALRHEVFPIDRLGKLLTVGMVCPLDSKTIGELETATGLRVKPILCSAEDVRRAINRYYPCEERAVVPEEPPAAERLAGLETTLKLGSVITLIRRIESLPTLPETVNRVREAMLDPESSAEDVAGIITTDPPIAAKVLSVANSAAYGFAHRIDNVRLAVSLLGLRELYSIVLSAAIINRYETSRRFDYRRFWTHSAACAAACKVVAQASGHGRLSSVPTAGLLHDLGMMALLEVAPDLYAKVGLDIKGDAVVEAEEKVIGISHGEAGYELAEHWGFPPDLAEAIRFHHRPEFASTAVQLVAIVAAGDLLLDLAEGGRAPAPELFYGHESKLLPLGLTPEDGATLLKEFAEQRVLDARSGNIW